MNNFWGLTAYEYKKIFSKKSVIIALFLTLLLLPLCACMPLLGNSYVDGKVFESYYKSFQTDRDYLRALAGRRLETDILMEASAAYNKLPDAERYTQTEEYQTFARPYSMIYMYYRSVYQDGVVGLRSLTREKAGDYYNARRELLLNALDQTLMSDKAKKAVAAMDAEVATPFTLAYEEGYSAFLANSNLSGILAAFLLVVCIAPMFAGEYTRGTDQLLLSSRYGKNLLIRAKVFAGFSLAAIFSLGYTLLFYLSCMLVYGFDGGNAQLQLYLPSSPYPLTLLQAVFIVAVCSLLATLFSAAVTMLLSAWMKTPFGVMILITIFLIAPMMVNPPSSSLVLYHLYTLLPAGSFHHRFLLDITQFEVLGLVIKPYLFIPAFSAAASAAAMLFLFKAFRNHQVS